MTSLLWVMRVCDHRLEVCCMGEMADAALDSMMDAEETRLDFHLGRIGILEAHELGVVDELGYEQSSVIGRLKVCRYCGQRGLHWIEIEGGWRLAEGIGKIHSCSRYVKR